MNSQTFEDEFEADREAALDFANRHGIDPGAVPSFDEARETAVMVAACRASYVLAIGSGLGYPALHTASVFGYTGRLDLVEASPAAAAFVEERASAHAIGDRVRVTLGAPSSVVPSLSGPYDVIVASAATVDADLAEDLVRLLRTGGAMLVRRAPEGSSSPVLTRLARDARLLWHIPVAGGLAVGVKRR